MVNGNGTKTWIALIVTSSIAVGTTMWGINGSVGASAARETDERSRINSTAVQVIEAKLDVMAEDIRDIKEAVR